MSTIIDVAKEAEVSVATVSRVLNNSFMVTHEKRERVLAAIEKVGYKGNFKNKEKKRTNSKIILVITSVFIEDLFNSFQETSMDLGFHILYQYWSNSNNIQNSKDIINLLKNNAIAGIVLLDIVESDIEFKQLLNQYPVVQIGKPLDLGNNFVVSANEYQTAYDVVSHLISTGKKRIAIITIRTENKNILFERQRERGYLQALSDNNIPFDESLKYYSDFTIDGGSDATKKILNSENRPDAIFCISDTMAIGCMYRLKKEGIAIPDQISVAGIDNSEITEFLDPPLTTADQSFKEIGFETIKMLVSLINGDVSKSRKTIIDHELIVRSSTCRDISHIKTL